MEFLRLYIVSCDTRAFLKAGGFLFEHMGNSITAVMNITPITLVVVNMAVVYDIEVVHILGRAR